MKKVPLLVATSIGLFGLLAMSQSQATEFSDHGSQATATVPDDDIQEASAGQGNDDSVVENDDSSDETDDQTADAGSHQGDEADDSEEHGGNTGGHDGASGGDGGSHDGGGDSGGDGGGDD
ncbi:MAG: hypothetical protein E5X80_09380 [Mesorhizobium sp.]|uniref:hypothetical protein n=1 Tax=Mesorhizobium sp. TaxID=1871066 RepID=UPI001200584C|nr:hypothetical protein [Mesorhizobium sp.]TIO51276.1 MAG: hypothetical protein E5X78_17370 [Mesorhizobium sp.]TIO61467.1 MAG: hypothetical protein E5X79_06755 [Mesorhizobium sp.]TJV65800.1 MAG: hypothetical protein E5X80_09380 [Mesorhizobium sp.]